jgi:PAS domain S-box-containing protein
MTLSTKIPSANDASEATPRDATTLGRQYPVQAAAVRQVLSIPSSTGRGHAAGSINWALDLLPIGVCICDRYGRVVRRNRCAIKLSGRVPGTAETGDDFLSIMAPARCDGDDRGLVARVLASGLAVRDLETGIRQDDGSFLVVRLNVDPLRDDAGDLTGAVICLRDVTESRQLRREVRDHEGRARKLLEALPVSVYTTDPAGRITFYNQAALALWGRRPVLGVDRWYGSIALRWPDGRPMRHDESPMAVCLREQRAISGAEAMAERPDGTHIHFLAYPTPLLDDVGHLSGVVNTLVDITELRRNEELTRFLASIVDSSNDAIISQDLTGRMTSWNRGAERLFGYRAAEAIGQDMAALLPMDRRREGREILQHIRHGGQFANFDTVRQRKDGKLIDVSLAVSPVNDPRGRIVGASTIARDISDRKRAAEQQVLALREMCHRVRNVFALASAIVTLTARFATTPQELAENVRTRLNALLQAHDLTLPDLSEASEKSEKRTTIEALLGTILFPFRDTADCSRIAIGGPEVTVRGSAVTGLALLLHEFATNAAKHGALAVPQGRLLVEWSVASTMLDLVWKEADGPVIVKGDRSEGFGSLLGHATVQGQLGGSISKEWCPEGLTIRLCVPLARLSS